MAEPANYPLAWPPGRPRTKTRRKGQFSEQNGTRTVPVSLSTAVDRLEDQVTRLGGVYFILSTNIQPRLDGRPAGGRASPEDPGVCAYFRLKNQPYAMACDTFTDVAQNIAAIAGHIEATRRIERYGVATAAETLQAFVALPPPAPAIAHGDRPWRQVLGFAADFPGYGLTDDDIADLIATRYRAKARSCNEGALQELNVARDAALAELRTTA